MAAPCTIFPQCGRSRPECKDHKRTASRVREAAGPRGSMNAARDSYVEPGQLPCAEGSPPPLRTCQADRLSLTVARSSNRDKHHEFDVERRGVAACQFAPLDAFIRNCSRCCHSGRMGPHELRRSVRPGLSHSQESEGAAGAGHRRTESRAFLRS